jgi:hypothetical protein
MLFKYSLFEVDRNEDDSNTLDEELLVSNEDEDQHPIKGKIVLSLLGQNGVGMIRIVKSSSKLIYGGKLIKFF